MNLFNLYKDVLKLYYNFQNTFEDFQNLDFVENFDDIFSKNCFLLGSIAKYEESLKKFMNKVGLFTKKEYGKYIKNVSLKKQDSIYYVCVTWNNNKVSELPFIRYGFFVNGSGENDLELFKSDKEIKCFIKRYWDLEIDYINELIKKG